MQVPATPSTLHDGGRLPVLEALELLAPLLDEEPLVGPSGVESSTTSTSTSALSAWPCSEPNR